MDAGRSTEVNIPTDDDILPAQIDTTSILNQIGSGALQPNARPTVKNSVARKRTQAKSNTSFEQENQPKTAADRVKDIMRAANIPSPIQPKIDEEERLEEARQEILFPGGIMANLTSLAFLGGAIVLGGFLLYKSFSSGGPVVPKKKGQKVKIEEEQEEELYPVD